MILLPREFEALTRIADGSGETGAPSDQFLMRILIGHRFIRTVDGQWMLTAKGRFAVARGVLKRCREREFVDVPDSALVS